MDLKNVKKPNKKLKKEKKTKLIEGFTSNDIISIWKNKTPIRMEDENYYPVGTLIINDALIQPGKEHSTSITENGKIIDKKEYKDDIGKFPFTKTIETQNKEQKDGLPGYQNIPGFAFTGPKDHTILVTGDTKRNNEYEYLADNGGTYERNNVTLYRLKCPEGYDSLGDIAIKGLTKDKDVSNQLKDYACLLIVV